MLREKFNAFADFAKKCSTIPFDDPYFVFELPLENATLKIVGLNSALMSWRDNEDWNHELWVGPRQLDDLRQKFGKVPEIRIALVHHPLEAYHVHDLSWSWPEIQKSCCILMHGHLHAPKVDLSQGPEHLQLVVSGGSVHEGGVWRSQHYTYGSLNLEKRRVDLYMRMSTLATPSPLFVRDSLTYPKAGAKGHIDFLLAGSG